MAIKILFGINIFLVFCQYSVYSQPATSDKWAKNSLYAELQTKGAFYTINFDRVFHRGDKLFYSYRLGFSIEKSSISFPLGISLLFGYGKHHAEFALTLVPFIDKYKTFLSGNNISDKYLYIIPAVGYRFQRASGGFFLKLVLRH